MIVGQKWRIAPPTAHDHEKPERQAEEIVRWRGNVRLGRAGVTPGVGGKRPQAAHAAHAAQTAGRKRQARATTAGFCKDSAAQPSVAADGDLQPPGYTA
jgi:hypothetical protein